MHWKTYTNALFGSVRDPGGDQHPSSLHQNPPQDPSCARCRGHPQGMGQSSGTERDPFRSSTPQKGRVQGRNLCKTSRTTFLEVSANPFPAVPAGNGSYTPHRERCCIQVLPALWDVRHTRSVSEVSMSSGLQTQDKYISKKSPSHFFQLINVGNK